MLAEKLFEEPTVYRLQVPFQNVVTTETNVYVIQDGNDTLIVDMGAPTVEAQRYLEAALAELSIDPIGTRYAFTHLHYDHSGLVERMLPLETPLFIHRKEIASADKAFAERIASYIKDRLEEEGMDSATASLISAPIEIATPLEPTKRNVTLVEGGDVITVGRFPFEVIDLPGHTRGMMGLYQPDSGICFSGDQLLFLITPATGLFLDRTDAICAYDESMHRLLSLDITHLFHSHGDIRQDFRERALYILKKRQGRYEEIADIVNTAARGEGKEFEGSPVLLSGIDVISRMRWSIPFPSIADCDLHQQWLIYVQGISMLDHAVNSGRILRIEEPALEGYGEAGMLHRYRPIDPILL